MLTALEIAYAGTLHKQKAAAAPNPAHEKKRLISIRAAAAGETQPKLKWRVILRQK
jgi:hypothetical protein